MVAPYTSAEFLAQKTVVELRAIAKSLRITGYSRMRKAELVETIDHARTDIIEYGVKLMIGDERSYAEREEKGREQDTWSGQEDKERPEEGQVREEVKPPPASQVVQLEALELRGEEG